MSYTLKNYLNLLMPWLPDEMVNPAYKKTIFEIADKLPIIQFGCFETWLAAGQERVDFNVLVRLKTDDCEQIIDTNNEAASTSITDKTTKICERWNAGDFHLKGLVNGFWMIYDIKDPGQYDPWLWHYPELARTSLDSDPELKVEIPMQVLKAADQGLPEKLLTQTRNVIRKMPREMGIHCIGANLRSGSPCIRFSLTVPDLKGVKNFLIQNNWAGQVSYVDEVLAPISQHVSYYGFGIDLEPGLKPQVGVKIFVGENNSTERMAAIADYLVGAGICSKAKREALVNWIGESLVSTEFPQITRIRRNAYLKFVFEPGKECFVKAYSCYYSVSGAD